MNYLIVKNKGLIEPEDLTLFGSSTKRDNSSKIGQFGSGNKFALAVLARINCLPTIYRGTKVLPLSTGVTIHRNTPVTVLKVNGRNTDISTEAGLKWKEWMALREILCNAIDEGNHQFSTSWNPEMKGEESVTTFYIPMNNELANIMRDFNSYFSFERTVTFQNDIAKVYFKKEESPINIYRKDIKCFNSSELSKIDFSFNNIYINESRLTENYYIHEQIAAFIKSGINTNVLLKILELPFKYLEYTSYSDVRKYLIELLNQGKNFTCPSVISLTGILTQLDNPINIPSKWYQGLIREGLIESPFSKIEGAPEDFIRTDLNINFKEVNFYLSQFNITNLKVMSGKFQSNYTDIKYAKNKIFIKDDIKLDSLSLAAKILTKLSENYFYNELSN